MTRRADRADGAAAAQRAAGGRPGCGYKLHSALPCSRASAVPGIHCRPAFELLLCVLFLVWPGRDGTPLCSGPGGHGLTRSSRWCCRHCAAASTPPHWAPPPSIIAWRVLFALARSAALVLLWCCAAAGQHGTPVRCAPDRGAPPSRPSLRRCPMLCLPAAHGGRWRHLSPFCCCRRRCFAFACCLCSY